MNDEKLSQLDISKRLRELMLNHDLTVAQLAEIGGISKSAMEKYIAGPSSPRAVTLANICIALSVSPSWLMFGCAEYDEIVEISAFTTSVMRATAELLREIKSDENLLIAFSTHDISSDAWKIFQAKLPYSTGKRAYAEFKELQSSIIIGQPIPLKRAK